jgi:membrane-associated phospholipid phosphatase
MIQFINQYLENVKQQWKLELQKKKFRLTILGIIILIIPFFIYLNSYLQYIEQRSGCVLNDALLNWLPAMDLSNIIFFILYTSALILLIYSMQSPWLLLKGINVLIVLQYIRNICLYVTPLNAPAEIFALQDPVLELIAYNDQANLKDLFFSGHTATIFIFMLLTWNSPGLKLIFGFITFLMAILLLIQHCHYTVDIIGGVACAYLSFKWVTWIWMKIQLPVQ